VDQRRSPILLRLMRKALECGRFHSVRRAVLGAESVVATRCPSTMGSQTSATQAAARKTPGAWKYFRLMPPSAAPKKTAQELAGGVDPQRCAFLIDGREPGDLRGEAALQEVEGDEEQKEAQQQHVGVGDPSAGQAERYPHQHHRGGHGFAYEALLLRLAHQREDRDDGQHQHRQVDLPVPRFRQSERALERERSGHEQAGHHRVEQENAGIEVEEPRGGQCAHDASGRGHG